jgi:uncharacterized membrane protein
MIPLIMGLVLFFALHLIPTSPDLRQGFVARFGENTYKLVFSVVSAVGLVLIVLGYHKLQVMPGKNPLLWSPPLWTRHVALALMLPAMILLVAAYVPSNIRDKVRHPMLAAVKVWALAHLLANGDLASLALFGSFLAYAVYDRISVKRRGGGLGPLGERRGGAITGDLAVVAIGVVVYVALLGGLHGVLFGVEPLPGWKLL